MSATTTVPARYAPIIIPLSTTPIAPLQPSPAASIATIQLIRSLPFHTLLILFDQSDTAQFVHAAIRTGRHQYLPPLTKELLLPQLDVRMMLASSLGIKVVGINHWHTAARSIGGLFRLILVIGVPPLIVILVIIILGIIAPFALLTSVIDVAIAMSHVWETTITTISR
jgi:hypothetical protein